MFSSEQIKSFKNYGFLGAFLAQIILGLNSFLSSLSVYIGNSNFSNLSDVIYNLFSLLLIGCLLFATLCFFLIFLSNRSMIDLVTTGFLGIYAGFRLIYLIITLFNNYQGYDSYSVGGIPNIASMISAIAYFVVILIFIVRARKTNMLIMVMGIAALLGSLFSTFLLSQILFRITNYNMDFVNVINSLVWAFVSVFTSLFFFIESKTEVD